MIHQTRTRGESNGRPPSKEVARLGRASVAKITLTLSFPCLCVFALMSVGERAEGKIHSDFQGGKADASLSSREEEEENYKEEEEEEKPGN